MTNNTCPIDSIQTRNNSDEIIGVIMGVLSAGLAILLYMVLLLDCFYVCPERFGGGLVGTGIPIIDVIVALVVSYAIIGVIVAFVVSPFVGVFYILSDFLLRQRA